MESRAGVPMRRFQHPRGGWSFGHRRGPLYYSRSASAATEPDCAFGCAGLAGEDSGRSEEGLPWPDLQPSRGKKSAFTIPTLGRDLTPELQELAGPLHDRAMIARDRFVEFRPSPVHGTGGFAKCAIPAGTCLIEYVGENIDKSELLR